MNFSPCLLLLRVSGIGQAVQRRASARACDLGRLRPLPLHRVPPAVPARGLCRIDGFGDEYAGGVCRGGGGDSVEEISPLADARSK